MPTGQEVLKTVPLTKSHSTFQSRSRRPACQSQLAVHHVGRLHHLMDCYEILKRVAAAAAIGTDKTPQRSLTWGHTSLRTSECFCLLHLAYLTKLKKFPCVVIQKIVTFQQE